MTKSHQSSFSEAGVDICALAQEHFLRPIYLPEVPAMTEIWVYISYIDRFLISVNGHNMDTNTQKMCK